MSEYTEFYVGFFTKLHEMNKQYGLVDEENIIHGEEFDPVEVQQAWQDLQAVPSYVETQARAWANELGLEVAE